MPSTICESVLLRSPPFSHRFSLSRCAARRSPIDHGVRLIDSSPIEHRRGIRAHHDKGSNLDRAHHSDSCLGDEITFQACTMKEKCRPKFFDTGVNPGSDICDAVKFALVFGILVFQGSQDAIAGTDVGSGIQSLPLLEELGDISTGFASAFLLIFFSELGDKTFFIAALLAARNSGAVVFLGTFGALTAMTVISVILGRTFHYVDEIIPLKQFGKDFPIDDIAAVCLLVYFGVTTLIDATSDDSSKAADEQKEAELAVSELSRNGAGIAASANTVISTFLLVFVAEWGDKSFFSTIALAAASSPLGVIAGASAGHAVATLLAVVGGSLIGTMLSEKAISYVGGTLFLLFAAVTLFGIVT